MGNICPCLNSSADQYELNLDTVKNQETHKTSDLYKKNQEQPQSEMQSQRKMLKQPEQNKKENLALSDIKNLTNSKPRDIENQSNEERYLMDSGKISVKNIRPSSKPTVTSLQIKRNVTLDNIIDQALEFFNKKKYSQSVEQFLKALAMLESETFRQGYSDESLQSNRISVLFELIQLQTVMGRRKQVEKYYEKCLKLIEAQPQQLFYQEEIALRNNYALFLSEEKRITQAIHFCHKAKELQEKYFILSDIRYYVTLINLANLYDKNGNLKQAEKIYQKIKECKDSQIIAMAELNKKQSTIRKIR